MDIIETLKVFFFFHIHHIVELGNGECTAETKLGLGVWGTRRRL